MIRMMHRLKISMTVNSILHTYCIELLLFIILATFHHFQFFHRIINFVIIILDEDSGEYPDIKVFRSLSRNNAHVAIDPRQEENENLMSSLSSQNSEDLENKDDEVSFIKIGTHKKNYTHINSEFINH